MDDNRRHGSDPDSCHSAGVACGRWIRSLRVLMIGTVLVVAMAAATVAFLPLYIASMRSADRLAQQYTNTVAITVASNSVQYFAVPQHAVSILGSGCELGGLLENDEPSIVRWMGYANSRGGDLISLIFDLPGAIWTASNLTPSLDVAPSGTFVLVKYNTTGGRVQIVNYTNFAVLSTSYTTNVALFRSRVYYPLIRSRRTWGPSFVGSIYSQPEAVLPCGQPLLLPNGTPVGAIYVRSTLMNVINYLQSLRIATSGHSLIFDPSNGDFVGSSSAEDPTLVYNSSSNTTVVAKITDVRNALIARTVATMGEALTSCEVPCSLSYGSGSNMVYVSVLNVTDSYDLNKRVVVMIPSDDFLSDIRGGVAVSVGAAAGSTVALMILAVVAVVLVVTPLKTLARFLHDTRTLDDLNPLIRHSLVTEIRDIEVAFDKLQVELKKMRAFLPQSVLELVGGSDASSADDADICIIENPLASQVDAGEEQSELKLDGAVSSSPSNQPERDASTTKRSRRLRGAIHRSLNMECVLATKRVTVVVTNVDGFHSILQSLGPVELHKRHAALLAQTLATAKEHNGVVDHVLGDHFYVSWNTSHQRKMHASTAARFVIAMQDFIRSNPSVICDEPLPAVKSIVLEGERREPSMLTVGEQYNLDKGRPRLRFGVASGTALCGNFGCEGLKQPNVIGPVVHQAFALAHQCKIEKLISLCNGEAAALIRNDVIVLHWNFVMLPQNNSPCLISTIVGSLEKMCAVETMKQSEEAASIAFINRGFEEFQRGNLHSAKSALTSVPSDQWLAQGLRDALRSVEISSSK